MMSLLRTQSFKRTVAAVATSMAVGSCGAGSGDVVVVSAASSLTDAFTELVVAFEESNPSIDVKLNLAGSSALREQILEGADVDVFASADLANVVAVGDELVGSPMVFARNVLVVGVPRGNPAGISGLEDFERSELLLGICIEGVPCGVLADRVLSDASLDAKIDTFEPNVRALLAKIESGELDAGLVYATDVVSSTNTESIAIPFPESSEYAIGRLTDGPAADFVEFVLSEVGREILQSHGFELP